MHVHRNAGAPEHLSDAELCDSVRRAADSPVGKQAFSELYRRHRAPAMAQALVITRDRDRADDLVAEAFVGMLRALSGGKGPTGSVLGYLLVSLRSNGVRSIDIDPLLVPVEPSSFAELIDTAPEFSDRLAEHDQILRAIEQLPPRARQILWLLDVEDVSVSLAAEHLEMSQGALRVAAHRARRQLGTAYLQQYVEFSAPACRPLAQHLAEYVRGTLSRGESRSLTAHLENCADCAEQATRLHGLQSQLRTWVGPLLIGGASGTAVAAVGTGDVAEAAPENDGARTIAEIQAGSAIPGATRAAAWLCAAAGVVALIAGTTILSAPPTRAKPAGSPAPSTSLETTVGPSESAESPAPSTTVSTEDPSSFPSDPGSDATPYWRLRDR